MSIIEETLSRLGQDQAKSADIPPAAWTVAPAPTVPETADNAPPPARPAPPEPFPALAGALPATPRRPSRTLPRLLAFTALGGAALSAAAWYGLEQLAPHASPSAVATPAPPTTPSAPSAASAAPLPMAARELPAEQAAATPVLPSTPHPAHATAPVADAAPAQSQSTGAPRTAQALAVPPWLGEGRRLLAAGDTNGALGAWSAGFATLAPQQRVVAVAAFHDLNTALAALKKLAEFDGAFLAPGSFAGAKAWRLLLLADPERRHDDLARAIALSGVKGGAVTTAASVAPIAPPDLPAPSAAPSAPPSKPSAAPREAGPQPVRELPGAPPATRESKAAAPAAQTIRGNSTEEAAAKKTAAAPALPPDYVFDSQAERVVQALNRGHYREAEELAQALLARDQNRSEPWLWMGKVELGKGSPEEAERYLARATEIAPGQAEAWTLRGIAAQERGDHPRALTLLAEALRLAPDQADAHFNIGYSQEALGRHAEAAAAWRRFLELAKGKSRFAKQRAYVEQRLTASR
ncbi:MAG: tetratricopeptide repeat protein [Acetobacteraceae bacterium]|nr:tetratricopeptide repeat protein [Acetobacteraceae bacterium]